MELNLSRLFDRETPPVPAASRTISGQQFFELTLPPPYSTKTQISIKNYRSEIDFICKRKNIPKELQDSVIDLFERNLAKVSKPLSSLPQTAKARVISINSALERSDATMTTESVPGVGVAKRAKERDRRQTLNLNSTVFKKVTREIQEEKVDPYRKKPVKQPKPNPKIHQKLHQQTKCKKPLCNQYLSRDQRDKLEEIKSLQESQHKPTIDPVSDYIESNKPQRKKLPIYERLYKNSIVRDYRVNKVQEQKLKILQEMSSKSNLALHSRKLIKNDKPFLERVEQQLVNRRNREQFISMKNIDSFKPTINFSSAKPRVFEFMHKSVQKESQQQKCQAVELINRSVEIVRQKQNKYIRDITAKLFVNGQLLLNADTISRLNDEEFPIIYPFLMKLQGDQDIRQIEFEQAFQKYFRALPINQKHILKSSTHTDKRSLSRSSHSHKSIFAFKPKLNNLSLKMASEKDYESALNYV